MCCIAVNYSTTTARGRVGKLGRGIGSEGSGEGEEADNGVRGFNRHVIECTAHVNENKTKNKKEICEKHESAAIGGLSLRSARADWLKSAYIYSLCGE